MCICTLNMKYAVTIARRPHLFPYRTQKLSSLALMILGGRPPGKARRCRLFWSYGQAVKTPPFHGGNPGSIPGRITKIQETFRGLFFIEISTKTQSYQGFRAFATDPLRPTQTMFKSTKLGVYPEYLGMKMCDFQAILHMTYHRELLLRLYQPMRRKMTDTG